MTDLDPQSSSVPSASDPLQKTASGEPDTMASSNRRKSIIIAGVTLLVVVLLVAFSQNWFGGDSSSSGGNGNIDEAVALINAGDYGSARAILEDIVGNDSTNVLANYNLGVISQFSGDNDSAIGYYTIALEGEPLFANALYNLGLAYRDVGQTDLAVSTLETLVANYPDNAPGLFNLGNLLIDQGDEQTGEAYLTRAKTIDPSLGS